MTKGPRRLVLDQYLDSAAEGSVTNAGHDWKEKADDLRELGNALKRAAAQAELRIGEQTLTGPALRAGMEESAVSMVAKSEQLRAAGQALQQVGRQIADTRDARDAFTDLGPKPSPYQAPAGTPGVEPTDEEIAAQAAASQARQNERGAWQTQYDKQEARSLALTKEMDAAFLGAIPPMKEIHGEKDPTEPPPHVPSGPGGSYLPGTQAPPPTGGGSGGGTSGSGSGGSGGGGGVTPPPTPTLTPTLHPDPHPDTNPHPNPTTTPTHVHTDGPTTTVTGTSQNGVTYQPTGPQVSAPASTGGASGGTSAAALGAAGGAGGMAAGAVRPGSAGANPTRGSGPVRPIGSTGRAGSAGALSRSAGSSAAARSAGSTGSSSGRGTGSAPGRGASSGSTAGRGATSGSTSGRGGAGGRGAGSSTGSRSGGRGTSGSRSGGSGTGTGGGRGGRKGERDQATDRDGLVYDQDWLGDDDVAPGVLD